MFSHWDRRSRLNLAGRLASAKYGKHGPRLLAEVLIYSMIASSLRFRGRCVAVRTPSCCNIQQMVRSELRILFMSSCYATKAAVFGFLCNKEERMYAEK